MFRLIGPALQSPETLGDRAQQIETLSQKPRKARISLGFREFRGLGFREFREFRG